MLYKSGLVTAASGSLGGITASHNRGGQYLRARVIPTNPNTARQQTIRARFGYLADYWTTTLTEAERLAWTAYGSSLRLANALGNAGSPTGQQAFQRTNLVRLEAGLAVLEVAPVTEGEASPIVLNTTNVVLASSASTTPNVLTIPALTDIPPLGSSATDVMNVYISKTAIPAGVEFVQNIPRLLSGTVLGNDTFPLDLDTGITVTVGETYVVRIIQCDAEGRVGPEGTYRLTAVTVP